jgi:hypothetical protein
VGTSNWQNISHCVGALRRLMPTSVLDVGTGFGRWGVLCREFLDAWEGREARALWRVRIDGIEAFPSCLTPLHGYIYDQVHVGDAVDVLPTLGMYDVIYMGDVVEHQTTPRAWQLLDAAVAHARQAAIVTIPIGDNWPQEVGADGNWFHAHRSVWQLDDFDRYPTAIRQCFSDYHGRLYLVIEIPGQAVAQTPAIGRTAPDAASVSGTMNDLLQRVDENMACRGLVDDDRASAELSRTMLFQVPASAEIRRRLDQLEREGLPWVPPFLTMVDALYRHLETREASRPYDERACAPSPDAIDVLERLASALASLAEHAHGHAQLAALLRNVQAQLDALQTRSTADLLAAGHPAGGGRSH